MSIGDRMNDFEPEDVTESYFQTKRREELAEVRKQLAAEVVTESYFQTKIREQLAWVREVYEERWETMRTDPKYVKHERRYPGRIAEFKDQTASHLDEAEHMIPKMHEGPLKKALWNAFLAKLQVADDCVRQALWDHAVQYDIKRQVDLAKPRPLRWPDLDNDIRCELERNPKASYLYIWKRLTDPCANDAYYFDDDKICSDDSGRKLQFGGFKKRVLTIKKEIKK